jgi:hypothetical protein
MAGPISAHWRALLLRARLLHRWWLRQAPARSSDRRLTFPHCARPSKFQVPGQNNAWSKRKFEFKIGPRKQAARTRGNAAESGALTGWTIRADTCVCVCVYIYKYIYIIYKYNIHACNIYIYICNTYIYIYIYTHTHTHIYTYIYYITDTPTGWTIRADTYVCVCVYINIYI